MRLSRLGGQLPPVVAAPGRGRRRCVYRTGGQGAGRRGEGFQDAGQLVVVPGQSGVGAFDVLEGEDHPTLCFPGVDQGRGRPRSAAAP
jgi:hypothetical protein